MQLQTLDLISNSNGTEAAQAQQLVGIGAQLDRLSWTDCDSTALEEAALTGKEMHSRLKQQRQLFASSASRILACSGVLPVTTTHTQQPATRDTRTPPPAHTKQCRATAGHDSRRSNGATQDECFAGHAQRKRTQESSPQ